MSNCKICTNMAVCDWETPPADCLDYYPSDRRSVEDQIYDSIDEHCEVISRGGARHQGWVRGVENGYLLLQSDDKSIEALDIEEGLVISFLGDSVEWKYDQF